MGGCDRRLHGAKCWGGKKQYFVMKMNMKIMNENA